MLIVFISRTVNTNTFGKARHEWAELEELTGERKEACRQSKIRFRSLSPWWISAPRATRSPGPYKMRLKSNRTKTITIIFIKKKEKTKTINQKKIFEPPTETPPTTKNEARHLVPSGPHLIFKRCKGKKRKIRCKQHLSLKICQMFKDLF